MKCRNLNFSFRVVCNRCQLTKIESEKLNEQYKLKMMNYMNFNNTMQNMNLNQNFNTNFYVQQPFNSFQSQNGNEQYFKQQQQNLFNYHQNYANYSTNESGLNENIVDLEQSENSNH